MLSKKRASPPGFGSIPPSFELVFIRLPYDSTPSISPLSEQVTAPIIPVGAEIAGEVLPNKLCVMGLRDKSSLIESPILSETSKTRFKGLLQQTNQLRQFNASNGVKSHFHQVGKETNVPQMMGSCRPGRAARRWS